jgi:hypothetical protein
MNCFDALRLHSIHTILNEQIPKSPDNVRSDGTG